MQQHKSPRILDTAQRHQIPQRQLLLIPHQLTQVMHQLFQPQDLLAQLWQSDLLPEIMLELFQPKPV